MQSRQCLLLTSGHALRLTGIPWTFFETGSAARQWIDENLNATTTDYNHPEPIDLTNDPLLLADQRAVRWSCNNYYLAHMRNIGFMSMALDANDNSASLQSIRWIEQHTTPGGPGSFLSRVSDGNQVELYRIGEWLRKDRTGWDGTNLLCSVGRSDYHNTLTLENGKGNLDPGHFLNLCHDNGSQWKYIPNGDGRP